MIIDCADGLEHFFRRPNGQFTVGGGRGWFVHFGAHFGDGKKDEKIGSKKSALSSFFNRQNECHK